MEIETKDKVIFVLGAAFAVYFTVIAYSPGFLFNAANFTFCLGIFHVIAGMITMVRNFDIFKAFRYRKYKRDFWKHGKADHSAAPLDMAEYIGLREKQPAKNSFLIGIPLVALSVLFTLAV